MCLVKGADNSYPVRIIRALCGIIVWVRRMWPLMGGRTGVA